MSISSAEAKDYALSKAAKEIKFVVQILLSVGILEMTPGNQVDNMGASIPMSKNVSASSRMKHMDSTRYQHFVHKCIGDGFIQIVFLRTANNVLDYFTNNIKGGVYEAYTKEFVVDRDTYP